METVFDAWRVQLDDPDAFRQAGVTVRVRPDGHDNAISVVVLLDRVLVSLSRTPPADLRAALENHRPPMSLVEEATMTRLVGGIERTLGPAVLGYLDADRFRPQDPTGLIAIDGDDPGVRVLAERSGPEDAAESDVRVWSSPVWVLAEGDAVIAAAGFEIWADAVGHLGVLTDPAYRNRGLGRRVAGAAVAAALQRGLVPQWRARSDGAASRRVAQALGFEERGGQAAFWPQ